MNAVARAKLALGIEKDSELARSLEVSTSVIPGYHKRGVLPLEQSIKIAEQTGVSLDWLILGKGEAPKTKSKKLEKEIQLWMAKQRLALGLVDDNNESEAEDENKTFSTGSNIWDIKLVPLYDVPVSAGHGSFFDAENIIQQIPFDAEWLEREELIADQLACLPIKGDSMSPGLKTSDIVLIDLTHQRGDGVFVLRLNGALRIKRLQWLADGRLRISSDNPIYETEYVDPNTPPDDFAIIGFCHTKIGRVV